MSIIMKELFKSYIEEEINEEQFSELLDEFISEEEKTLAI